MQVFIVTLPHLGWDSIVGCFSKEEEANRCADSFKPDRACVFDQLVEEKYDPEQ